MEMALNNIPLTTKEALSGISGIISLAAWFLLLLPQLWENYSNQSADGISLAFLLVWFAGDVANLLGALWGGLLPTIVALGIYFCILDSLLIAQTLYYRTRNAKRAKAVAGADGQAGSSSGGAIIGGSTETRDHDENSPLLHRSKSIDSTGDLPYTRRRLSSTGSRPLPAITEQSPAASAKIWAKDITAVFGVCLIGAALWAVAYKIGWWKPQIEEHGHVNDGEDTVGAEILGYISSILYLGARLPQIYKNWREKSCDGLSLLFFMLSTLGNASYGAQILFHSVEVNYFFKNLPWLIGSLGTIVEDIIIFIQFNVYAKKGEDESEDLLEEA